ncbi:hypothetical protein [Bythopirellula goksoeyrii]|uniref:Transmembrane protein n=1 Tax=Bythopirellula goksoeyrii TaxID=1400387 RepID=A0A5B9QDJ9_9BACT|nr:hypothetical protein [Bythopirellula goksoeyrii]QEG35710.1 hypothetical protein Pr1d_30120 [Bythopirellula goksoeyrii]
MSTSLNSPAPRREPHLLKFGLKQLFLIVTLAGLFCTLIVLTHGPWPLVILAVTLLLLAHVLGNLIGTRLRDTSQEVRQWRATDPRQVPDHPHSTPEPYEMAKLSLPEETNLANFSQLVRGMRWFLLTGFLIGTLLGGTLLAATIGNRVGWSGWVVGTISSAVLGTWVAFLGVSFTAIARDALRQAHSRQ